MQISDRTLDRLGAGFLVAWNAFAVLGLAIQVVRQWPGTIWSPATVNAVSLMASAAFFVLQTYFLCVRRPPIAKAQGLASRAIALAGTHLPVAIILFDRTQNLAVQSASAVITAGGTAGAIYTLWYLGRSFSVFPQARRLVTTGPYSRVRHPLYLFEEISVIGIAAGRTQPWALLIAVSSFLLQIVRMKYEERVLDQSFPEYPRYAASVSRLLPGIY
jgi:protein-S-isoprenylcysteine O-methyltransferase Ste14